MQYQKAENEELEKRQAKDSQFVSNVIPGCFMDEDMDKLARFWEKENKKKKIWFIKGGLKWFKCKIQGLIWNNYQVVMMNLNLILTMRIFKVQNFKF